MLSATRHEQQEFGERSQRLAIDGREEDSSDARADLGAAGFTGQYDVDARGAQASAEKCDLRGLPGEIEPLKDDQLSGEVDGRPPPTRA